MDGYKRTETAVLSRQNMKKQDEDFSEITIKKAKQLALTLNSIGRAVIATDINANSILINHSAEILTGWPENEAIGMTLKDILPLINWLPSGVFELDVDRVLNNGETFDFPDHTVMMDRNRKNHTITGNVSPIRDDNNEIIGMVLSLEDVTEKHKMEEDILKIQRFESFGILAGGIAHDFNNILTAILGNVSLAKIGSDPKDIIERLAETEKALDRAKYLTQQLLNFSKDGMSIKEPTSIGELLCNSINFMLSGSNVKGHFDIPNDLWMAEIDENQISQVITNLAINAIQAMPNGGTLRIYARNVGLNEKELPPLSEGDYVKISIEDEGTGISDGFINRIFEPYFTTKKDGSGLGLAVSLSIIRNHNGHITVVSQLGVGTTFNIYLPVSSSKLLTKNKEMESHLIHGKGKVLVLDDDELIRELTYTILGNFGYDVVTAKDGTEVIKFYEDAKNSGKPFDALIMDLTIPGGMGAKDTFNALIKFDPDVKAIITSGYSSDPIITDYRDYGFSGAIVKPYGVRELSSVLNKVIMNSV